jgi:hypothetical protein
MLYISLAARVKKSYSRVHAFPLSNYSVVSIKPKIKKCKKFFAFALLDSRHWFYIMLVTSINIDVLFILHDLASRLHSLIILQSTRGVGLQALVNSTICLHILGLQNTLSLTKNYNNLFVYSCKSCSIEYISLFAKKKSSIYLVPQRFQCHPTDAHVVYQHWTGNCWSYNFVNMTNYLILWFGI